MERTKKGERDEKELSEGKKKEEGVEKESGCLWSLTTDAGISRHTTIFTLGIPVILTSSDEQSIFNLKEYKFRFLIDTVILGDR